MCANSICATSSVLNKQVRKYNVRNCIVRKKKQLRIITYMCANNMCAKFSVRKVGLLLQNDHLSTLSVRATSSLKHLHGKYVCMARKFSSTLPHKVVFIIY